ncbi:PD-(D/E)XK nuclease family protein [Cytobacillus gottheilii]|jgi:CRISPR/Cas system-associated exonuclease Cas4 (RecB family)|uniref:PD-(D/E)XK nuclease family protein n=1 Tax=Cytobacillus gottheilii TaxID=859144 RepID=UPI00082F0FEF|nr:PD-(D/E)XK nuclease family protein [Cytobacillus gottheilii]
MRNNYGFWSLSKHKMLMECEMKWALNYHISKRGEFDSKPPILQLAWRLKHLKNVFLLFGDLLHKIIEEEVNKFMETGEVLSKTKIRGKLSDMLEQSFRESQNDLNLWYKDPKANTMLYEIYYDGGLGENTTEFIKQRIDKCVSGFIHSKTINELIIKGNVKIMEAEKFRSFYVDGVRVVLSADLIYHDQDNEVWGIVDWKSGKQTQHDALQLSLYAMYLENTYGAKLQDILVSNDFLESGTSKSYVIDTYETDNLRDLILQSAKRMAELEENLHKSDTEVMELFHKTENKERCDTCNFKAICLDEQKDIHINNFLRGIGRKKGERMVKERDIIMMREFVRSGMPVDERVVEFLEESPYETEDSYRAKLERMSEFMEY